MARSRFAELQQLEAEVADLTERLETRKLVDRAKGDHPGVARRQRARRVPVDPEDSDGFAAFDAQMSPRVWSPTDSMSRNDNVAP